MLLLLQRFPQPFLRHMIGIKIPEDSLNYLVLPAFWPLGEKREAINRFAKFPFGQVFLNQILSIH